MGSQSFNIAKGRVIELANRVNNNDPVDSGFIVVLAEGAATDIELYDFEDLAALLLDPKVTEASFNGYARKTITNPTVTINHASDYQAMTIPDQVWNPADAGNDLTRLFVCYAPDTAGADATIIPMTFHDFVFTTRGAPLTMKTLAPGVCVSVDCFGGFP